MKAFSIATTFPGPKGGTSSSSGSAGCTTTRTSNCSPTPRERQSSTPASSPATRTSISCSATPAALTQFEYLAGKHWVNNNYSFYVNDNWHVTPRLTLNLGIRYDGLPHAFERYNQFANFVPADYDPSLGNPVTADGTLDPRSADHLTTARTVLSQRHQGRPGSMDSRAATCRTTTTPGNRASALPTMSPETARLSCAAALACSSSVFRATMCITLP